MSDNMNRIALVTGGAQRIGRAIALELAGNGWTVAIHCNRSEEAAQDLAGEIRSFGGQADVFVADLMDAAATEELVARVASALGPVSCLVNNASIFENDDPKTVTRESWQRHMTVNLHAPFLLSQAFARSLPAGTEGNIINIVDQRVLNPTPHFTSYTLSKSGLWTLTQTLALALAPSIRVNAIGPGPVLPSIRQTEEQFTRQWSQLPLARPTAPEEIAGGVRFVLDAPSMTGQIITLDSGQHLGWAPCPGDAAPEE